MGIYIKKYKYYLYTKNIRDNNLGIDMKTSIDMFILVISFYILSVRLFIKFTIQCQEIFRGFYNVDSLRSKYNIKF